MATTIVIKVQYGEILRRFISKVVDGKLDLDMNALREKVISLFSFPSGSDLAFTYVDEDGDVVTLADEEDLDDIMRQFLNPLRITVKLNRGKSARSHSKSNGTSTPVRSPGVQPPLQVRTNRASKPLNSFPDTVRETISTLSSESVSDTNSALGYNDLPDTFAKLDLTHIKEVPESGAKVEHSKSSTDAIIIQGCELKSSDTEEVNSADLSENFVITAADMKTAKGMPSSLLANTTPDSSNVPGNLKQDEDSKFCGQCPRINCDAGSLKGNKVGTGTHGRSGPKKKGVNKLYESSTQRKSVMVPKPLIASPFPSLSSSVNKRRHPHHEFPFNSSYNYSVGSVVHRGVQCDGCGAYPITGPRFKSKVNDDYDLCSLCFADKGNEAEYMKMDHPMSYQIPAFSSVFDPMQHHMGQSPALLGDQSKLDSCFIQDVNILDGTIMTPSTKFTKIWRMRNNGEVAWPQGTHLVWIGGSSFSKEFSHDLKIPTDGCPVGKEIDVAVDFTAPVRHGRYVSYWRMSSPSGHRFGQRVWVLIQVDSSVINSLAENAHAFNLNFPPVGGSGIMDSHKEKACVDPVTGDSFVNAIKSSKVIEKIEPAANIPKRAQGMGLNFPINTVTPLLAAVDKSKAVPVAISAPDYKVKELPSSMVAVEKGMSGAEKKNLKHIEEIKYKQFDDTCQEATVNELLNWMERDHIFSDSWVSHTSK